MLHVDIEPVQVFVDEDMPRLTSLNIYPSDITFNEAIVFDVSVMTSNRSVFKSSVVTLGGSIYKGWKGSDQYLIDIICQVLGYVEKDRDSKPGKFNLLPESVESVESVGSVEPSI